MSAAAPDWAREGRDWPNRAASRFISAGGLRWHVQVLEPPQPGGSPTGGGHTGVGNTGVGKTGEGPTGGPLPPVLLLLHGTGAATHSWRDLAPRLAARFIVVAPDLPGHGFTEQPAEHRMSLAGMARSVAALLDQLGLSPAVAVGHSAGAAILARMSLDGLIDPGLLVSLNGAILPLQGAPGRIFRPAARLLAACPLVPTLFAWRAADPAVLEGLLRGTGSSIDAAGVRCYRLLVRCPGHAAAALAMMANWDLAPLARDLPKLAPPLVQIVGANDRTIPPAEAARVRALLDGAPVITLPGLGHLAHEERPAEVAAILLREAETMGLLARADPQTA